MSRKDEAGPEPNEVTRLLEPVGGGDPRAAGELLPLVYEQIRARARKEMAGERPDHTLQAAALVHEAYARLVGTRQVSWDSRAHFYVAAAEGMRRRVRERMVSLDASWGRQSEAATWRALALDPS